MRSSINILSSKKINIQRQKEKSINTMALSKNTQRSQSNQEFRIETEQSCRMAIGIIKYPKHKPC